MEFLDFFGRVLRAIDANVIICLIPMILTLLVIEAFFRNKFQTKKVFNLVRWVIIGYTLISVVYFILGLLIQPESFAITSRASGPYAWAYWAMFISANLLPLTLLSTKIAANRWYLLFVAFFMKIGAYFEQFIIRITSFHRDFPSEIEIFNFTSFNSLLPFIVQGMLIAIVTLALVELISKKEKSKKN